MKHRPPEGGKSHLFKAPDKQNTTQTLSYLQKTQTSKYPNEDVTLSSLIDDLCGETN